MSTLRKRVDALECASGPSGRWHAIMKSEEQSYVSALTDYRAKNPDVPMEPEDNVMWIELVSPKLDANGKIIPRERSEHDGPSLAEVLAQAA